MPKRQGESLPSSEAEMHKVPQVTHNYRQDPTRYPALKTEQGVFTSPPYSGEIKGLWRFKDEASASRSSEAIWDMFEGYRKDGDFIGMDTARKFIQMGRTRSLRYALRKGGQKYEKTETGERGKEMKRTGKVYDQEKLKGANLFETVLDRCWADEVYGRDFERWRNGERWGSKRRASKEDGKVYGPPSEENENEDSVDKKRDVPGEDEEERKPEIGQLSLPRVTGNKAKRRRA